MEKISLVILNSQDIPLEKFVWDTSGLPVIPAGDLDSPYSLPSACLQLSPPVLSSLPSSTISATIELYQWQRHFRQVLDIAPVMVGKVVESTYVRNRSWRWPVDNLFNVPGIGRRAIAGENIAKESRFDGEERAFGDV